MVYTFDIFDTLITRTTAEPTGIFVIMQKRLLESDTYKEIPLNLRKHFMDFRVNAEAEARIWERQNGREDVTLDRIYRALACMNHMPEECVARLMELELATELENCVPVYENIERLKALRLEHDIYLLSDMYLPTEHIRKMLMKADPVFKDVPILVSGELDRMKGSGRLFSFFLEEYNVDEDEWVHIGDNPVADGLMSGRMGARSELYSGYIFSTYEKELLLNRGKEYAVQAVLGTVKNVIGKWDTAEGRIGASLGGPVLYGYVLWVLQEALRQGIRTLFFVARDGYLLKKIADVIIKEQKLNLQTRYLYGSRYAWRVPVVSLNKDDFRNWLLYYMNLSTFDEVIGLLHMKSDELAGYFPELFRRKGRKLSRKEEAILKEILLSDEELLWKIRERNKMFLYGAKAYLKQEISCAEGKIAFVEMNGSGFTQYCMQKLTAEFYKEPVVTFFYSMASSLGVQASGNIFYKYSGRRLAHIVELFVRAPHGQTLGYRQGERGEWIPVLDGNNQEYDNEGYTEYMDGVLDFTQHMCKYWWCQGEELTDISLAYVDHLCRDPEPEVQDFIGDLSFSQSGTEAGLNLYAPGLTDEQLRQLYLYKIPQEEWYPGYNLGFSLLRLTPEQREKAEYYKSLNMSGIGSRQYARELKGNIVLYGAGKRGRKVLQKLLKNQDIRVVLWADKNYVSCAAAEMEISSPSRIMETDFDCVLIGVASDKLAREIRQELMELGVPMAKILW